MLGGVCWPPIAARNSDSTTTTRVNEVTMMRMPGASDRTVSSAMICSRRPVLAPVAPSPRSMLTLCAEAANGARHTSAQPVSARKRRSVWLRRLLGEGGGEAGRRLDAGLDHGLAGRPDDD